MWKITLSKEKQKELDFKNKVAKINEIIPLHKVGIHWFGKCVFCNDSGNHFCVPDKSNKVVCYNSKCKCNWSIDEFFDKFKLI